MHASIHIRFVNGSDFYSLAPLINEWWGGRDMAAMLPKLFFDHFTNTSFVAKIEGEIGCRTPKVRVKI